MADWTTVAISVGTTLALQAGYFTLFSFPADAAANLSKMATFHRKHFGEGKEGLYVLKEIQGSGHVLRGVWDFYRNDRGNCPKTITELIDKLELESAKLRGLRGCNETMSGFVEVVEEKINSAITRLATSTISMANGERQTRLDVIAVSAAMEIHQGRGETRQQIYVAEMGRLQAELKALEIKNRFACNAFYLLCLALIVWFCHHLHLSGIRSFYLYLLGMCLMAALLISMSLIIKRTLRPNVDLLKKLREPDAGRE